MLGFWPLNEEYGGKNLATDGVDFELGNVGFDVENGNFQSAPAKFSTAQDSVAKLAGAKSMVLGNSFSWIGTLYRRATGDAALFEWDDGTHIWVYENKFYINVVRGDKSECAYLMVSFTEAVPVGEWVTLAVTYDGKTLSMYQNGKRSDTTVPACENDVTYSNVIRINER
jgi:hypothetical protein